MELTDLLALLREYNVKSFKNREFEIEFADEQPTDLEPDLEDFGVDWTAAQFPDISEDEPN